MRVSGARARVSLCLLIFVASTLAVLTPLNSVFAAQITNRSLTLEKNGSVTTGGSAPSAVGGAGTVGTANHKFTFTVPSTVGVRSVKFEYCTAATGTCTIPTDLSTAATTLGTASNLTSYTLNNTTNGAPYISGTADPGGSTITATLNAAKNPSAANTTFFVRITTFTSTNATTGAIDAGVVAASTATTITVTGTMPEYIQFCTGGTITVNAGVPDCSSATSGSITFNQEFSPSSTSVANSMMAASTNATSGYAITVTGTTLTAGANTIPAIGTTAVASNTTRGTSRFGLNLALNTTTTSNPAVGADINPTSNTTNLRALPAGAYDTPDEFALDLTGATPVASSDNNTPGTAAPTDSQAFTVTYMANVAGSQAPGTYVATLNYVCTATF